MGLNKHMMLEEHELEQKIAELRGEGEEDGDYWDDEWVSFADFDEDIKPPTATDLARADELERRLEELRAAQRRYDFLGTVVDGKPAPAGVSPRFCDHVEAFEQIHDTDTKD